MTTISEYLAQCDARYTPRFRDVHEDTPLDFEVPPPKLEELVLNDPAAVL